MSLDADVRLALGSLRLDVQLQIGDGELVVLLGPNGAGKTTLLRAIAGLVPLDRGHIRLDGRLLEDGLSKQYVPTEKRPIGYVFQDYLLFPHLSVEENIAFGLRARGASRRAAIEKSHDWLDQMGLAAYATVRPTELSGGQRQRVALARALATDPRLLLLDEPLAALDITTRAQVRRDLQRHLRVFSGLRLLVTHDPVEAMALADRLLVIEDGVAVQSGTPAEVTERPRTPYVADLVGVNLIKGRAEQGTVRTAAGTLVAAAGAESGEVFVTIHPRAVALYRDRPEGSPRNVWPGRVSGIEVIGERARVRVEGGVPLVSELTRSAVSELSLRDGVDVWLSFKATDVGVYPS